MIRKNSSFSISTLFPDILIKNNHELNIIEKEKELFSQLRTLLLSTFTYITLKRLFIFLKL